MRRRRRRVFQQQVLYPKQPSDKNKDTIKQTRTNRNYGFHGNGCARTHPLTDSHNHTQTNPQLTT